MWTRSAAEQSLLVQLTRLFQISQLSSHFEKQLKSTARYILTALVNISLGHGKQPWEL